MTFRMLEDNCIWFGEKMAGYGYPCVHPAQRIPDTDNEECCVHCSVENCPVFQGKTEDDEPSPPRPGEVGNHWQGGHELLRRNAGVERPARQQSYREVFDRGYRKGRSEALEETTP